jgi:Family of unknown function (DUF5670)
VQIGVRQSIRNDAVPYAIAGMLALLWLVGIATSTLLGGLIHLLLIIAVFGFVVNVMSLKTT